MKNIYIMVSYTGTILSNIIRVCTKKEYAHASISLDLELNELYSFGRINPYNAFIGGFTREGKNFGTFKRFKNTKVAIYSLEIEDDKYEEAKEIINNIKENKQEYRFNLIGLILVLFHKRVNRRKCFYCAEFVKYVLEKSHTIEEENLPEIIIPEDFLNLAGIKLEYKGLLRRYDYRKAHSFIELCGRNQATT